MQDLNQSEMSSSFSMRSLCCYSQMVSSILILFIQTDLKCVSFMLPLLEKEKDRSRKRLMF